jgi:hypothetical protein
VGAGGRLTRDRDDTDGSPWFRASREAVDVLDVIAVQSAFTSIGLYYLIVVGGIRRRSIRL